MFFKGYKIIVFLSFFCFYFSNIKAQEYNYISNITVDTKLQNHNITSIVQDSKGFLWIGTNLGLYRYDGYHFMAYTINTNPSILDNTIKSLLIDGDSLWIGSKGGINILNTNTIAMVRLTNQKNDDSTIANNFVTKLYKDKDNTIWVGYNTNKISKYLGNKLFKNYTLNTLNTNYRVIEILEASDATYILKLDDEKSRTTKIVRIHFVNNQLNTKILREEIYDTQVLFKIESVIYLAQNNKIFEYDVLVESFKLTNSLFENTENLRGLAYTDSKNTVYFGTNKSIIYCLTNGTNLSQKKTSIDTNEALINSFFMDNSGLLWVGTTNGLYKLKKQGFLFKKYLHSKDLNAKNKMRSILQDSKADIYTVNQESLFKYDSITNTFTNLNWINELNSTPYALIENDSNSFLVGSQGGGIGIYNKSTNILKNLFEDKRASSSNSHVLKLYKDTKNILWIGTANGLDYYNKNNDSLVKIIDSKLYGDHINKDIIYDIQLQENNQLWVGTSTGLYHLKVDYSTVPLNIEIVKIKKLPYEIRSILITKNTLWLATQSNGLIKYNFKTKKITAFNESMGLSHNTTYSILPGAKNDLWIGTLKGLSRFDTIHKHFLNFYDYDGLAGNEFNSSSQLKTKKGELLFGGQNGITHFLPAKIELDSTNFNLNLINISWYNTLKNINVINKNIDTDNITSLTIPYNNAFVKFEFALSNYFMPKTNSFKYKLNGLHSDWRVLKETNELSFTHLPPGEYALEVRASTDDGNWNINTMTLPIRVKQIFYKRWWFLTSLLVFSASFLFFLRKYELDHIKKMEQLRLKISRDLHDELGSSLTGIAIKSDLLLEKIDFKSKKEVLSEISELSRNAVDSLSDIVWAIDARNNSIQDLSDRMESILYQFLSPLNITCTFQNLQTSKPLQLDQDHRQHIFLIFKEAITNIMKHSNATHVDVSITKENNYLKLKIKDNGTIITKRNRNLNGNGIKNMKLRAKKIKGNISFNIENGFTVELLFNYVK